MARTAMITGASAGLGIEFARQLAARGVDLFLVARRKERLAEVARELEASFGVGVATFAADLSEPGAPAAIEARVRERSLEIDYLINNAGSAGPHLLEHRVDLGHDVLPVDEDRSVTPVAESDVQDGPVLGGVDPVTGEHGVTQGLNPGFCCELPEQRQCVLGHAMLGEVQQEVVEPHGVAIEPVRIRLEEIPHVQGGRVCVVLLQG